MSIRSLCGFFAKHKMVSEEGSTLCYCDNNELLVRT